MLLHKTRMTRGNSAVGTVTRVPSRGPAGEFVQILGGLYLRGRQGELRKLPKPLASYMLQQLEHRNATVKKARIALAIIAALILGVLGYLLFR